MLSPASLAPSRASLKIPMQPCLGREDIHRLRQGVSMMRHLLAMIVPRPGDDITICRPYFFNSSTYANANNFCVQKVDAAVRRNGMMLSPNQILRDTTKYIGVP